MPVPVIRFHSKLTALGYVKVGRPQAVFEGDRGFYWVVWVEYVERMERAGYKRIAE